MTSNPSNPGNSGNTNRPVHESESLPDSLGRFGPYGGKFVPETLMAALTELENAFDEARQDD